VELASVDTPFAIDADKPFVASVANIRRQVGAGVDPEALPCTPARRKGPG